MRVAILDNWISPAGQKELTGRDILVYHVANGECALQVKNSSTHSHGTVCSSILSEFLPKGMEVIGISCADGEEKISIENMCIALQWCLNNPPDYLCLSVGTCNWLEAGQIGKLTHTLTMKGTHIFAACANSGDVTFPAIYPWVTGVRYLKEACGMFCEKKSPIGYNIIVGNFACNALNRLAMQNPFFRTRSNSMATPYVLAQLLTFNKQVEELPLWKKVEPVDDSMESAMPIVSLKGTLNRMKELLALLQKKGYQAVLFTDRQETDWFDMVLCVRANDFVKWLKSLGKAGILLIDSAGELNSVRKCADYMVDLKQKSVQVALEDILKFFGTTEEENV